MIPEEDDDSPQKRAALLESENVRLKAELGRARQLINEADRTKDREKELEERGILLCFTVPYMPRPDQHVT